ncbi:MAG: single-stranded DNA-binding protein [Ruminococcaceae bacterium]|nr:single-stranded DNA-binding protein [Oscillospiraceae bacterium]
MLNNISVMGRLTADPEVRQTPNGVSVCSFTIANDKDFKRDGDAPNWIDCVAWRNNADFIGKYFKKGSLIVVTGSLQTRQYQDKNGNNRKATEVVVSQQYFAESKRAAEENHGGTYTPAQPAAQAAPVSYASADASDFTVTGDAEDDLPF